MTGIAPEGEEGDYRYWAFISYSHRDKGWANWLHRALETFRVPRQLAGSAGSRGVLPKRVFPVFIDRAELPTAAELGEHINEALRRSRSLVVICSPQAAASRWVDAEVRYFKSLGRADRVFCLVIGGEPNASTRAGGVGPGAAAECFPPGIRFAVDGDGALSERPTEPVAADARRGKDGRRNALLKLLAGLLGVPFDDLRRREEQRSRLRLQVFTAASLVVASVLAILSWGLYSTSLYADTQRREADEQRQRAQRRALQVRAAFSRSDFLLAGQLLARDRAPEALAHLCRALDTDPGNRAAVIKLLSTLTRQPFALRAGPAIAVDRPVYALSLGGDRARLLVGSGKVAQLWDPVGAKAHGPAVGAGHVYAAAIAADGRRGLIGSSDKTARVWDLLTGEPLTEPMEHGASVHAVALDAGAEIGATASADHTARAWDLRGGTPLTPPLQHAGEVVALDLAKDGTGLLTASKDGTARWWEIPSGRPLVPPLRHADEVVAAVLFDPPEGAGRRALTGSLDQTAQVWDLATGAAAGPALRHGGAVLSVAVAPGGGTGATGSEDHTARLWDLATGEPAAPPLRHDGPVRRVVFSPDGRFLATGSADGTARVWDAISGAPRSQPLVHGAEVWALAFGPGGRLITGALDGSGQAWQIVEPEREAAHHRTEGYVASVGLDRAGERLFYAAGRHAHWVGGEGEALTRAFEHDAPIIGGAVFLPEGNGGWALLTGSADRTARSWNLGAGGPAAGVMAHPGTVTAVAVNAAGSRALTGCGDRKVRLWDLAAGVELPSPVALQGPVSAVALSGTAGGGLALAADHENAAIAWDVRTRDRVGAPLRHGDRVAAVALSADGRTAVTGSLDRTARVWRLPAGEPRTPPLPHRGYVWAVALSADRTVVATGSWDGTARVWDVATGQPLTPPLEHGDRVLAVALSANAKRLATGTRDGRVRIWELPAGDERLPPWFLRLAEAYAGLRLDSTGSFERLPFDALRQARAAAGGVPTGPGLTRYVNWLVEPPPAAE